MLKPQPVADVQVLLENSTNATEAEGNVESETYHEKITMFPTSKSHFVPSAPIFPNSGNMFFMWGDGGVFSDHVCCTRTKPEWFVHLHMTDKDICMCVYA